ncbi:hypothetical protein KKD49_11040 [Myxococcota bacterium]|nr:hypothetical protein [Myxococcota bacterium]
MKTLFFQIGTSSSSSGSPGIFIGGRSAGGGGADPDGGGKPPGGGGKPPGGGGKPPEGGGASGGGGKPPAEGGGASGGGGKPPEKPPAGGKTGCLFGGGGNFPLKSLMMTPWILV